MRVEAWEQPERGGLGFDQPVRPTHLRVVACCVDAGSSRPSANAWMPGATIGNAWLPGFIARPATQHVVFCRYMHSHVVLPSLVSLATTRQLVGLLDFLNGSMLDSTVGREKEGK